MFGWVNERLFGASTTTVTRVANGPAPVTKWEHKAVLVDPLDRHDALARYGALGWELASVTVTPGDEYTMYFKRQL